MAVLHENPFPDGTNKYRISYGLEDCFLICDVPGDVAFALAYKIDLNALRVSILATSLRALPDIL